MSEENQPTQAARPVEHFTALKAGTRIGRYEIESVLGQGGFGITYRARDTELGRLVAIKEYFPSDVAVRVDTSTVGPRSSADAENYSWGLNRFLDEARSLAQFDEIRSVVRVFDYMQANGTAYMVMALVEGEPLGKIYAREGSLPQERLQAIGLALLDGLEMVHKAGFLHRDIKPSNIGVRHDGSPVLLDFGAARSALSGSSKSITAVFTPGYAPFEQYMAQGKQGPWTDIYALAATLYQGISGKAPPPATDRVYLDNMPPAIEVGAGHYDVGFLEAIDYGLAVQEKARPQSIEEWRPYLRQGLGAAPASAPGARVAARPQPPMQQGPSLGRGPAGQRSRPSLRPQTASAGSSSGAVPTRSRAVLLGAAAAVLLIGGAGAAMFFSGGPDVASTPAANGGESPQVRAQRLAEEEVRKQSDAEARRLADEARRIADADLKRKAEEAAKRMADEEARRRAEAEMRAEAERKATEAARKKIETELAEARRQAEEARRMTDELRQRAEAERKAAEELRQKAELEAKRKTEEDARRKADEEAKRRADVEAAKLRADEEARKKAEEARKQQAAIPLSPEAYVTQHIAVIKAAVDRAVRAKPDLFVSDPGSLATLTMGTPKTATAQVGNVRTVVPVTAALNGKPSEQFDVAVAMQGYPANATITRVDRVGRVPAPAVVPTPTAPRQQAASPVSGLDGYWTFKIFGCKWAGGAGDASAGNVVFYSWANLPIGGNKVNWIWKSPNSPQQGNLTGTLSADGSGTISGSLSNKDGDYRISIAARLQGDGRLAGQTTVSGGGRGGDGICSFDAIKTF